MSSTFVRDLHHYAENFCDTISMNKRSTSENLTSNLRHLCELYNFKPDYIAKKSGLSPRVIAYYLSGDRSPKVKDAELIAAVFGLEGWHLIMPNLPKDIQQTKNLKHLVKNYLNSSSEGRGMIDRVAEREAKYGNE